MGDVDWGQVVFRGTEDLLGMETELQLFLRKKKLYKAILILGPLGITEETCLLRYHKIVRWLNKKYGSNSHSFIERDPVIDELLYTSSCYPIRLGMLYLKNIWKLKDFIIESSIIGDDDGFFIEIEYKISNFKQILKIKEREVLKRL